MAMPQLVQFDDNPKRIAVRIATTAESDSPVVQDQVQSFLRAVNSIAPYRSIHDGIRKAAKRARTVLIDNFGNRAKLMELSDHDYLTMEYWIRDYIKLRPAHIVRRNRAETLERRRYLITLLRMAFPREMTTLGRSAIGLGLTYTEYEPLDEGW